MKGPRGIGRCWYKVQGLEDSPRVPSFSQYLSLTFSSCIHSARSRLGSSWLRDQFFPQTPDDPVA